MYNHAAKSESAGHFDQSDFDLLLNHDVTYQVINLLLENNMVSIVSVVLSLDNS